MPTTGDISDGFQHISNTLLHFSTKPHLQHNDEQNCLSFRHVREHAVDLSRLSYKHAVDDNSQQP